MAEVTVLYDEGCAFCTRLTARLAPLEGVSVAPIGSPEGARLLRDLSPAERYAALHVVDGDGRRQSGVDALPIILRRFRGGSLPARLIERFPGISARLYGLVARNRRRLSRVLRAPQ